MENRSIDFSVKEPPSPSGASAFNMETLRKNTQMVQVEVKVDVNEKEWKEFQKLAHVNKQAFLSMILNNGLRSILYDVPEIQFSFLKQADQRSAS